MVYYSSGVRSCLCCLFTEYELVFVNTSFQETMKYIINRVEVDCDTLKQDIGCYPSARLVDLRQGL